MVPGAAVLVASSRYIAGRMAESRFGSTVHILDDGFQHFELMRDVDLLIAPQPLDGARTLPSGRLREPLDVASAADALLIEVEGELSGEDRAEALCYQRELCQLVPTAFKFSRRLGCVAAAKPAFAFAGIARPERFYEDLRKSGWQLTGHRSFPDHHHYSRRDLESVSRAAVESGADLLLTTEKDAVRMEKLGGTRPLLAIPLEISIEPGFRAWLTDRLRAARSA
jgi:tetraacyldisaccharide 4'-kinase